MTRLQDESHQEDIITSNNGGEPCLGDTCPSLKRVGARPYTTSSWFAQLPTALLMIRPRQVEAGAPSSRQALVAGAASSIVPLRDLIKSSGIYAISSAALPLVALVLAPFLTHHLSPSDYGILTILNTVIGLGAGITQLGLGPAFFRAYGYDYTSSRDRQAVLGTVTILLCLFSIAVLIGTVIAAPLLARLLFGQPSFGGFVILAAGVVLLQNLTVPGFAWLRAESRAFLYSLLAISNLLVTLIANIVLVGMLHLGLAGSILATGCGYATVMLVTMPIIFLHAVLRIRTEIAWSLLTFGLPLVLNFVSFWVLQLSDRYLLSLFGSLAETARYAVAYTLGSAINIIVMTPFTLAWPTAVFTIAKREDAAQVFRIVFRWFCMFLLFAAFGLSLVGKVLLVLLFPVTYHSGSLIIPIVAVSIAFYGAYYVFMVGANITRKTWLGAVFTTVAALVNVALNLILIPLFGAMGAAISTLLAFVVLAGMAYVVNQRIYPISFEIGNFLMALLVGTALYLGSDFLGRGFGTHGAWVVSFCALCLYGGCLALLNLFLVRRFSAKSR